MKHIKIYALLVLLLSVNSLIAQKQLDLSDYSFTTNALDGEEFTVLMNAKLENSRFVFVGEQHGIKSAATATSLIYSLGQAFGYNTLCIETDRLAADKIKSMTASGDFTAAMKAHYKDFAFTIPFYNNEDDHVLFDNVHEKGGDFWGIDQTFVMQPRFTLRHLATTGSNKKLRKRAAELKAEADAAYDNVIATKDQLAPFIFQYNESTHKAFIALAQTDAEKELIAQIWKTKEIYRYYFEGKNYQNNNVRGNLMKDNLMRYLEEAQSAGKDPKVVFKLGAYHAARGLTPTNIYDVANMGSELAISEGKRSVHVAVLGITGKTAAGNPFAPVPELPFDNTDQLPEEIKKQVENIAEKYYVIDLEALRDYGYGKRFSDEFKELIFGYDLLILVNGAEAVKSF